MSKITVIAALENIDKNSLLYEMLKNELKNKKYENYFITDKKSFLDIVNFIKDKKIDFIALEDFQHFDKKGMKEFFEFIREKNINVYIISKLRKKIPLNQEPKVWHLDLVFRSMADEIIFLYFQNNKVTKKILNKEQIKEEAKQTPSLDRGLFGKLIDKKWMG